MLFLELPLALDSRRRGCDWWCGRDDENDFGRVSARTDWIGWIDLQSLDGR